MEIDVAKAVYEYLRKMFKIATLSLFCSVADSSTTDVSQYTVVYRFNPQPATRLMFKVPNRERVLAVQIPIPQNGIADQLMTEAKTMFNVVEFPSATLEHYYTLVDDLLSDLQRHNDIWTEHQVGTIIIYNKHDLRNHDERLLVDAEIAQLLLDCADLADIVYS